MSQIFDYYFVGDRSVTASELGRSQPTVMAFSKIRNDEAVPMHLHAYAELFYFESGYGNFEWEGGSEPIKPHDMIFVNANSLHRQVSSDGAPLTYYCITIDDISVSGKPRNCLSSECFIKYSLQTEDNPFRANISRLAGEFKDRSFGWFYKATGIFGELFVDFLRVVDIEGRIKTDRESSRNDADLIKEYIDENYTENINLDSLTALSMVSKSHLMRIFKKKFGTSPMQYLSLIRVEQAKTLLAKTSLNVTEVALKVGFDNPVYFTEVFSKVLGVSPSVFRKTIKRRNM